FSVVFVFFFFSSRRRHTRLQGDWSSDVCSSDLELQLLPFHRGSARQQLQFISASNFTAADLKHIFHILEIQGGAHGCNRSVHGRVFAQREMLCRFCVGKINPKIVPVTYRHCL